MLLLNPQDEAAQRLVVAAESMEKDKETRRDATADGVAVVGLLLMIISCYYNCCLWFTIVVIIKKIHVQS